jgi:hypothetical protein
LRPTGAHPIGDLASAPKSKARHNSAPSIVLAPSRSRAVSSRRARELLHPRLEGITDGGELLHPRLRCCRPIPPACAPVAAAATRSSCATAPVSPSPTHCSHH